MATDTSDPLGRQSHIQALHTMRWTVTYTDEGSVVDGPDRLPANAVVTGGGVMITTAFDDTTTIDVGFRDGSSTDDPNGYATALTATGVGFIVLDVLATTTNIMQTTSCVPTASVNDGSGMVSAGSAEVIIQYSVNNG